MHKLTFGEPGSDDLTEGTDDGTFFSKFSTENSESIVLSEEIWLLKYQNKINAGFTFQSFRLLFHQIGKN